jgi:hypothetical protein
MWRFKGLVDVVSGKMTLQDVEREIIHYMMKSPKRLIVDIQRREDKDPKGYYVAVWMSKKDFKNTC